MAIRRKRIDKAYRDTALTELAAMPITIDAETDTHAWTTTLCLSERFTLSLYDAAYLELAQRRDLPLASLDKQLGSRSCPSCRTSRRRKMSGAIRTIGPL
jgi:predicted nucleic acid-binding protein